MEERVRISERHWQSMPVVEVATLNHIVSNNLYCSSNSIDYSAWKQENPFQFLHLGSAKRPEVNSVPDVTYLKFMKPDPNMR